MIDKPTPLPLAMVICDTVIEDKATNKKSLIGLFNNIHVRNMPAAHPRLNVYIALVEGSGQYNGKLRLSCENKPLVEFGGPIIFQHPHQIVEFNFVISSLKLPAYGSYRFEFFCNDKLVVSRQFKVSPIPNKNKGV